MDNNTLRRLQLTELEVLTELDRVCRENDIEYVIAFGTMLGAVRHNGFIPWDDDIDVMMTRPAYEKFKGLRDKLNPEIAYFQDHDTDSSYIWGYGKLRRTGTRYVRAGQEHIKSNTGIFIDVFPMDGIPKGLIGCFFQDIRLYFIRKTLWSRVGYKNARGVERLFYGFLKRFSVEGCFKALNKEIAKNTDSDRVRILMMPCDGKANKLNRGRKKYGMEKRFLTSRALYLFENKHFYGTKDFDGVLNYLFNDYMTLPPEEKRVQNSPAAEIVFCGGAGVHGK